MAVNWNLRPYSQEELIHAWTTCGSISSVCKQLGIAKGTSTYFSLKIAAQELNLSENNHVERKLNQNTIKLKDLL